METTASIALSRQMVLRQRLDVIANNLANMTASGFQAEALILEPVVVDAGDRQRLTYVQDVAVVRDLSPGTMTPTGNPLDLALEGEGYFVVETDEGVRYGRSGQFALNDLGELVTPGGHRVLDDGGSPLEIPLDDGEIAVAPDGTISTPSVVVGRIDVVDFAEPQRLRKVGEGLYRTDQAPEPVATTRIVQGMLEGANVQPIVEMTEMMATVRAYQSTKRLLDTHHDLQRRAIEQMLQTAA